MKKAEARLRNKRNQRTALKKAERKKELRKAAPHLEPKGGPTGIPTIGVAQFPDKDFHFWLAHGVNYIVSDHENGTWEPVFDDIYKGTTPTPDEITTVLLARYPDTKNWTVNTKAAVAWAVTDRAVVHVYYKEVQRRVASAHPELERDEVEDLAMKPHQPIVWGVFKYLRDRLLSRRV